MAATTTDDLQQLAPHVPDKVRAAVEGTDPSLDSDLAAWAAGTRPHLRLLGPIQARTGTTGKPTVVAKRKAFYTELFGWEFVDQGDDFGGYNMIKKGENFIGGAMSSLMTPEGPAEEPQYPTSWTIYLDVADIDVALRDLSRQVERGFTTVCFKPAMFCRDASEVPALCRHLVSEGERLVR